MITDPLTLDVLKSTTTTRGELCAMHIHESVAICMCILHLHVSVFSASETGR